MKAGISPPKSTTIRPGKKKGPTSTAKRLPTAKVAGAKKAPSKTAKPAEVDAEKLTSADAKKRCAAIYKLERVVEKRAAIHTLAKAQAKSAKGNLEAAEDALKKEISEQRFGPGPLFPIDSDKVDKGA